MERVDVYRVGLCRVLSWAYTYSYFQLPEDSTSVPKHLGDF